ncbi:hypothetical protein PRK78_006670 [Emydomyces testavorans]|uniref:PHD-type domain-containing protein n=1 Tax=Emydomyces testavorans TaxID=2070801 RepID=A0AAF0IKQ8_9EURO|nr:hypothetical protein PRK78_006670 [Emydomyces testavorans]
MAPQLRSRTRADNDSRPVTPLDAPQNNATAASETSRPKKQRKTGANTRVPVDSVEEPARQRQRKTRVGLNQAGESSTQQPTGLQPQSQPQDVPQNQPQNPNNNQTRPSLPESKWTEPPTAKLKPTFQEYNFKRTGIFQSQFALGARPTLTNLRIAKLIPSTPKAAPKQKAKTSKGGRVSKSRKSRSKSTQSAKSTTSAKRAQAIENAINEATTSSSSQEEPVTIEDSPAQVESQTVIEANEPTVENSSLKSSNKIDVASAGPASSSIAPSIPIDLKCTKERFNEVIGSAISRAEASNDTKVADGLRWMLEASVTDPFLLKIMDDVVAEQTDDSMAVFQAALRDAVKRGKAGKPATTPAAAMGREDSTSSLSTAKSLEADTSTPAILEPANGPRPLSEEVVQATESEKVSWERSETPGSGVTPSRSVLEHQRKTEEPLSLEELAAKKEKLRKKRFVRYRVRESNLRTKILPQVQPPRKRVPQTDYDDASSVASVEAHRSTAQPAELDNNDFCRVCNGTGNLLCCDGCVDSFHFACLDPPLDSNSPPAGRWFCSACDQKGPGAVLKAVLEGLPRSWYEVPSEILDEFPDAFSEDDRTNHTKRPGTLPPSVTGAKKIHPDHLDAHRAKVFVERDVNGQLIICARCHRGNLNGERQVIKCDHCSLYWHLDCLDENYSHPPLQFHGSNNPRHYWKCPNHLENMLGNLRDGVRLRRRRRHQEYVDIEVLPSAYDTDLFREEENYGKGYRVSERGVIQNFIERVKRDHAEEKALQAIEAVEEQNRALLVPVEGAPGSLSKVGNADADAALSNLRNDEREGALALLAMAEVPQPVSGRVGQLVSQLVATSPETIRNVTSEIELLQSLQGLISQRLQALAATPSADVTN